MIDHLAALSIEEDLLQFRDERTLGTYLESLAGVAVTQTGSSREDRALYGLRFGRGSRAVSIIAGCHADEPIGPMTAQALPRILSRAFPELWSGMCFTLFHR